MLGHNQFTKTISQAEAICSWYSPQNDICKVTIRPGDEYFADEKRNLKICLGCSQEAEL